jgi:hypothetical protein
MFSMSDPRSRSCSPPLELRLRKGVQPVKQRERVIYPEVIDWYAAGRLKLHNETVWLDGHALERPRIFDWTGEVHA